MELVGNRGVRRNCSATLVGKTSINDRAKAISEEQDSQVTTFAASTGVSINRVKIDTWRSDRATTKRGISDTGCDVQGPITDDTVEGDRAGSAGKQYSGMA